MTPKQFSVLAAAAAVSLAAAIAIHAARAPWTATAAGTGKLLPGIEADAARIARISVTQGGDTTVIAKTGDQWLVESQDGYPAGAEKVRALLIALAEADLVEAKTANPERFRQLNVDDPASETSTARLLKFEDEGGAVLGEVIAGKQRAGQAGGAVAGTYVRRPGENQSWLANVAIPGGTSLRDWAQPRVFETQTETIKSVTVAIEGADPYVVKRDEGGSGHALADIPAGKKIRYVNIVDNIVEAASFLDLERVRKAGGEGGKAGTVTLELDSGLKIAFNIRREKDGTWATIDATGEGDAKKAADDIMTRAKGWEFELLPSKTNTMLKPMAELVEDDTPQEPAGQQQPAIPGMPGMPPGMPGMPPAASAPTPGQP